MGCRLDARDSVQRPAKIIVIAIFCRAGVDAHACGQRANFAPVFRGQCALRLNRSMKGREWRLESHAKSVADRFENISTVGLGSLAHKSVMAGKKDPHTFWESFPEPRAADYVREKKRDDSPWRLSHVFIEPALCLSGSAKIEAYWAALSCSDVGPGP
jgi:hypothetical protein